MLSGSVLGVASGPVLPKYLLQGSLGHRMLLGVWPVHSKHGPPDPFTRYHTPPPCTHTSTHPHPPFPLTCPSLPPHLTPPWHPHTGAA
jgi:hypothetical protein